MADSIDLSKPIIVPKKVTTIPANNTTIQTPDYIPDEMNDMINAAKEVAESNEDIMAVREERTDEERMSLETEDEIKMEGLPEGVTAAKKEFALDPSGKPIFTTETTGELKASEKNIFELDGVKDENDATFRNSFISNAKVIHNMSDEDAIYMLDLLTLYRKDKTINIYAKLPESVKSQVKQICMSANVPLSNANMVAKMMMDQMIEETAADQTFIDFEKSLDTAMKIPSLIDIYEEHVNETMEEKIPAMANAIKDEDPEKAKMLMDIGERYTWAKTYSYMRDKYEELARIRKYVRKQYSDVQKRAENVNYMNRDSSFRMPDATILYPILIKKIANDPDNDIDEVGVQKFLTLLFSTIEDMDAHNLLDAAYIYYVTKNISMLSYVDEDSSKSADSFSVELISNIKALIYYLTMKEEEFNASNQSGKRSKRK